MSDIDRLMSKVVKSNGCWDWDGGKSFRLNRKVYAPKRASWIIHYGALDKDLCVKNTCLSPTCVNPEHLTPVSRADHNRSVKQPAPRTIEFYEPKEGQSSVVRGITPIPIPIPTKKQYTRIMLRVEMAEDCWLWTYHSNDRGYGYVSLNGKSYMVHRFMYAVHHKIDPGNFIVDHICNNRLCCNPAHLQLLTPKENARRCVEQGRHFVGIGNTTVPVDDHHKIVDDIISRRKTMTEIAKEYDVGRVCISRIVAKYEDVDMRRKLTGDDTQYIIESDENYQVLSDKFSVSTETISRVKHMAGCEDKRLKLSDEQKEFILNSTEKGSVLANQFGVHACTVYRLRAQARFKKKT